MSKFTIASDQEVLGGATDDTLIEISRVPSLDGQSMSKDVRANSAVPITFSNSDKLGDRCERVARQISPKHSAILGSRTAADMRKAGIECHALSEADEDLTGICLCQPEPKIPRPRNAFILYRQHRQAQVAAQNPKLTNPEISKVIGEYWRAEPEPIKEQWKAVADEEKLRHQQQYPEYRYQPRRPGRRDSSGNFDSLSSYVSTGGELRCKRCGGRNISTSNDVNNSTKSNATLAPLTPSTSILQSRCLPMINNLNLKSPGLPSPNSPIHIRDNSRLVQVQARPSEDAAKMMSPDGKRRRLNYQYLPQVHRAGPDTPHPFSSSHFNREAILRQRGIPQSSMSKNFIDPPPRKYAAVQLRQTDQQNNSLATRSENDQSRSVEAMVMSIPLLGKLKVLSSIAPPLKTPGVNSPVLNARGTLIAVEGDCTESADNCASHLENLLRADDEFIPKRLRGPRLPEENSVESCLKNYLDTISEWHARSTDMKTYITSIPPKDDPAQGEPADKARSANRKPVIIIPGYQLHASDEYASRINITDAYAPTDHWQWMATLWRGIIGADLTIYVKDCSQEELLKEKPVEIRDDARCIIVRKSKDSKTINDSAFRRLSFEVGEWVRSIALNKN